MSQLTFPTAPGTTVNVTAATGGSGTPAPNSNLFIVGIADRGPAFPVQVLDFLDFQAKYGGRNSAAAILSDSVEGAFAEGAFTVYVSRVLGPSATYGFLQLQDRNGTPVNTMKVSSYFAGADSASLSIGIVAGTVPNSFDLLVYDAKSPTPTAYVEAWRDNTTVANAVAAINAGSSYITAIDNASASSGVSAFPALTAGTALSVGSDDRVNASDTTWGTAINSFSPDLGGGFLLAPGRYTSSFHLIMQTAAVAQRRFVYADSAPLPAASDMTALALADSVGAGYNDPGDSLLLIGPWGTLPPAPGGSVVRQVPYSALLAGRQAALDAVTGHCNQPAMGVSGDANYANGITGVGFTEAERATINGRAGTTGAVVVRSRPGHPSQVYGSRTVAVAARGYFSANIRETLAIDRDIQSIGDNYVGTPIDGAGRVFADLANDIGERLLRSFTLGALFGLTAKDAFGVDVGSSVNTRASIRAGLIRARVWFIPSPTGERVIIDLVRASIPN